MNYIENKAGEETICLTCQAPLQETGIVEFVINRAKNASNPSSVPSTPSGPSSTMMSEDEATEVDAQPRTSTNRTKELQSSTPLRGMMDLD